MSLFEWVLLIIAIFIIISFIIFIVIQSRNSKAVVESKLCDKQSLIFYDNVKVVRKEIKTRMEGLNLPKCIVVYCCLFLTDVGEEKVFSLSKEVFDKIEEGQVGTLVLIKGQFFDFGEGEDV